MRQIAIGATVWNVSNDEAGNAAVYRAVLLGRNHSWHTFANPKTGERWKENGMVWHPSLEAALRHYLTVSNPFSQTAAVLRTAFGGDEKKDLENYVKVGLKLLDEWKRQAAPADLKRHASSPLS